MPNFDPYNHLIVPLHDKLSTDPRFAGIEIFYDRSADEIVAHSMMPSINYFLQNDWEDVARGSNTASVTDRTVRALVGFGAWAFDTNRARLDEALFQIVGNLIDFIRENTDFDRHNGVAVSGSIRWTPVGIVSEDNNIVGLQVIVVPFELYSGQGV